MKSSLSRIYEWASNLRNWGFDQGWLHARRIGKPVVSLGNLTVGGTGKTPMMDLFLLLLKGHGRRAGVVTRSYRASLKGPRRVDASMAGAAGIFGDEAVWLARRHPDVPVWAGPVKNLTAAALVENEQVDLVLVDDGFQHRRLHRDVDLLLMDSTESLDAYRCLPAGRGREAFTGIERADAILLTKTNLADAASLEKWRRLLSGRRVFEFEAILGGTESAAAGSSVLLVSGIARPASFVGLAKRARPDLRFDELSFRDHHPYSAADVATMIERARQGGSRSVWTTEKDAVKLEPLWPKPSAVSLTVLPLTLKSQTSPEGLYELFR